MAYATPAELVERFTLGEVKRLAPAAGDPGYDEARVIQVLDDASAELDSYLAVKFEVPIAPVPELLKKFTCDLAREALDGTGRTNVIEAGKRARAWARSVAAGTASLGAQPEGEAGRPMIVATRIDGQPVGDGQPGSVYDLLYAGYQAAKLQARLRRPTL